MVQLAAHAGLDPWPLSLRELVAAAEAKENSEWDRTADIIANIVTALSGPGVRYGRLDFHPFRERDPDLGPLNRVDPAADYERLMDQQARKAAQNATDGGSEESGDKPH